MPLRSLCMHNPDLALYDTDSPLFKEYGRKITDLNTREICEAGGQISLPESGSVYEASTPAFEALGIAAEIRDRYFGELPTQIGCCYGYNHTMNALEWHAASEINIVVTDLVLLVAKRSELVENRLDSSAIKAFLLRQGEAVEIYATTLHFCPCQVSDHGFICVVGLPQQTNLPLEAPAADPLLFRKNKWLISHVDNTALIERGAIPGIYGTNYTVKY